MREEEKVSLRAPEFPEGLEWMNSDPLTLEKLRGKVVLVDIWDYTCVNCIRALPYVKEWNARYGPEGLVVIGVHTPEFDFAKDSENVKAAVERYGITYPVVLDNDYELWSLYANQYWPREYLIDTAGYIVYDHAGEGNYPQTELFIQRYLERAHRGARFPEPYKHSAAVESGDACYPSTQEVYCGHERGRMGSPEGYDEGEVVSYSDPGDYKDGYVYANGLWLNQSQSLRHARKDPLKRDYIALKYHALSVNAVTAIAEGQLPYKVFVTQDGQPVSPENRGSDLKEAGGETYFEVSGSRLYFLVRNAEFSSHTLKLTSESMEFDIYSFTFGSCKSK